MREDRGETTQLNDLQNVASRGCQNDATTAWVELPGRQEEDAQTGTAYVVQLRAVDHKSRLAALDVRIELRREQGCCC